MYFPLIVHEALMIEPTETESLETLDAACGALLSLFDKAGEDPDALHAAPVTAVIGRPDEAAAARRPVVRWA
jgi:glycine dehydrogenase subunit 2